MPALLKVWHGLVDRDGIVAVVGPFNAFDARAHLSLHDHSDGPFGQNGLAESGIPDTSSRDETTMKPTRCT